MNVNIAELFRAEGYDDENATVYKAAEKKHLQVESCALL